MTEVIQSQPVSTVPAEMLILSPTPSQAPDLHHGGLGLYNLTTIDQLFGKTHDSTLSIFNKDKQQIFFAEEESDCINRNCCGSQRSFDMKIKDAVSEKEAIFFYRQLRFESCCFPFCLQKLEVREPNGKFSRKFLGSVEQNWKPFFPSFSVKNENGKVVMKIEGPSGCACTCVGDVKFDIMSLDGQVIGNISKNFTKSDGNDEKDSDYINFCVNFPMGIDVKMKAVLLGACFLINFMYFKNPMNLELQCLAICGTIVSSISFYCSAKACIASL